VSVLVIQNFLHPEGGGLRIMEHISPKCFPLYVCSVFVGKTSFVIGKEKDRE
jgi:hypothetical protein